MLDRAPLDQPLYGASFGEAVSRFWRKYAVFTGRASRSEFWWAELFIVLVSFAVTLVLMVVMTGLMTAILLPAIGRDGRFDPIVMGPLFGLIFGLYAVVFLVFLPFYVPLVAVSVRRLHDAGYSGLWALLYLVPVGSYVVLVLCILESRAEGARFDAAPPQPVCGSDPDPSSTIRS